MAGIMAHTVGVTAAAGVGLNWKINGAEYSVADIEVSPSIAVASVSVGADGALTFSGNIAPSNTRWLAPGADASKYEARWDTSSGTPSGAAVEEWLALGTSSRIWTETKSGVGVEACSGTITIRNASNTAESISFTINPLSATVES